MRGSNWLQRPPFLRKSPEQLERPSTLPDSFPMFEKQVEPEVVMTSASVSSQPTEQFMNYFFLFLQIKTSHVLVAALFRVLALQINFEFRQQRNVGQGSNG